MDQKANVNCPKCGKLLAKILKGGCCKDLLLYCRSCKKEYRITLKEQKEIERADEPKDV